MSQNQKNKLMPNLDKNTTNLLNLTVLQRIDPFVDQILITVAHVTFYQFNIDTGQWSRKDVEGSLFVVKRDTQPRFQFIVMNRRNTDNLVENLLGDFEYEVQQPYLLYRNASQEVNGIWFYNGRECEEVANLFGRILNAYSKTPTKLKVTSVKSEFKELEAVPSLAVIDGPLEPSSSTNTTVADVPNDPSFVNFFSSAMNIGVAQEAVISGQQYYSNPTTIPTHPQRVALPASPKTQAPRSLSASAHHIMSLLEPPEANNPAVKRSADLVKPSFFGPPPPSSSPVIMPLPVTSSAVPTVPPLNPPGCLQRPYGAPLLQPFPPPTPPPSLTAAPVLAPNYSPVISRGEVREALQVLVQDNQFIDMFHRALMNARQS